MTDDQLGLVERLRQQYPDTPHHRDQLHRDAADEIERAWAARDAAVADLEAHAEAEVRRAVAAERERCARLCEDIGDAYQTKEAYKWAELKTDAQTGAHECAAAIRA